MDIIDDRGRLFGTVNIIDAFAVLLVLAVAVAGATFILGNGSEEVSNQNRETIVTVEVDGVQPYIADAIPEGPIETERVATVENKSVRPTTVVVSDQNGTLHERRHPRKQTVTLRISLNTTVEDGEPVFAGKPLEVGRVLTLDLGPVTVKSTVTNIETEAE